MANVLKMTNALFPHIKAEMLETPACLHLSGKYREVLPENGATNQKARLELFFVNSQKTAIVNATQVLKIVEMYGAESDGWEGKPIVLYADKIPAFGKTHNVVRVANMKNPDEKRAFQQYEKPASPPARGRKQSGAKPAMADEDGVIFDEQGEEQYTEATPAALFDTPATGKGSYTTE